MRVQASGNLGSTFFLSKSKLKGEIEFRLDLHFLQTRFVEFLSRQAWLYHVIKEFLAIIQYDNSSVLSLLNYGNYKNMFSVCSVSCASFLGSWSAPST